MLAKLSIKITALTPLVLTGEKSDGLLTESREYIAGSIVRGALASRYIESRGLGREAHLDADFARLFNGALAFTPGYLCGYGPRTYPVPLSVQKHKVDSSVIDLMRDEPQVGYKGIKYFAAVDCANDKYYLHVESAQHNIALHISRSGERERIAGKSIDGGIYNYESVLAGTEFMSEVIGSREALASLVAAIKVDGDYIAYIGRSKHTQYGKVKIELLELEPIADDVPAGDSICLRLDSDMLGYGVVRSARALLEEELFTALAGELGVATEEISSHFHIEKIMAKPAQVNSFVGVWGMQRASSYGLAAGSIFRIVKDSVLTEAERSALAQVIYRGVGARRVEGFGQLRVWVPRQLEYSGEIIDVAKKAVPTERGAQIVRNILLDRVLASVSLTAYDVATKDLSGALGGKTHALVRLENLLTSLPRDKKLPARFQKEFCASLRSQSAFEKNLQALRLRGIGLNKILDGTEAAYSLADFMADVPEGLAAEVGFRLEDYAHEVFYTYYLWLFRHARKRVVEKGASEND